MMKRLNSFIYGTQYWRAPTPTPEEWDYDFKKMRSLGIDTIQLRVQWRWHEPKEDVYIFEEIDRIIKLAQKYKKKILFKFMMETAPDYIYLKYDGYRRDMFGNILHPGAHGAYYIGGWWPCFDNPYVIERAKRFVEKVVERYKDISEILVWNIWNEPRSRPIGECGCKFSIISYQEWLRKRYKTIESLNDFLGKKWEDFSTIRPPGMPYDYAELFLWRKWALSRVAERLRFMYHTVRKIDKTRPIIAHVGSCNISQDVVGDGSDDIQNSKIVDMYGTSFSTALHFTDIIEESRPFMVCDWLRSVDKNFLIYELYPDWGDWNRKVSRDDFRFKVFAAISCGAKGLVYWQYRAERLGNENNLAGLVNIDGSFKHIKEDIKNVSAFIKQNESFLVKAKVKEDPIGILYSLESDLISRVEETGGAHGKASFFWTFDLKNGYPYLYKKSLFGIYALFRELGFTIRFCDTRKLKEQIKGLKLLYIPQGYILSEETINILKDFITKGGYIIAEEGFGLRNTNTWLNPIWPGELFREIVDVNIEERVAVEKSAEEEMLNIDGCVLRPGGYISYLQTRAQILGRWKDNRPGCIKENRMIYIGTSLGASFYENYTQAYEEYIKTMKYFLQLCEIKQKSTKKGIYTRILQTNKQKIVFIFDRNTKKIQITGAGNKLEY